MGAWIGFILFFGHPGPSFLRSEAGDFTLWDFTCQMFIVAPEEG
jgi:hypothetical protein